MIVKGFSSITQRSTEILTDSISVQIKTVLANDASLSVFMNFGICNTVLIILIWYTSIKVNCESGIVIIPSCHPRETIFALRATIKPFVDQFLFLNFPFFLTVLYLFALCNKIVLKQRSESRLAMHTLNHCVSPIIFLIKSSIIFILINENQTNTTIFRES